MKRRISQAEASRSARRGLRDAQRRLSVGKHPFSHLAFRIAQRLRGLLLCRRTKEIERADRFKFTSLLAENSSDRTRLGNSEAGAQPLDGFDQFLVFSRSVKERTECPSLLGIQIRRLQDMRRAVDAAHVLGQAPQALPIRRGVRQQVDAFAQHRAAHGFERAQHSHPGRGIVHGKTGDVYQPFRVRWWRFLGQSRSSVKVPPSASQFKYRKPFRQPGPLGGANA